MRPLLENKHCIVTGGSKGIGRAVVQAFLAEGASVEYYSRSEISGFTHERLSWTRCDISDAAAFEAAIEASLAARPADVLVNNAGITRDGLVFRMSLDDWNSVIAANLTGAFIASKAAARLMIKRRTGSIVNIASVVGLHGNGGQTNYAASKAGLIGFTKSLAKETAGRGVRVNAVAPGYIETAMTSAIPAAAKEKLMASIPLGRAGSVEEAAAAVVFLASDLASYITGAVLQIDGGMSM